MQQMNTFNMNVGYAWLTRKSILPFKKSLLWFHCICWAKCKELCLNNTEASWTRNISVSKLHSSMKLSMVHFNSCFSLMFDKIEWQWSQLQWLNPDVHRRCSCCLFAFNIMLNHSTDLNSISPSADVLEDAWKHHQTHVVLF